MTKAQQRAWNALQTAYRTYCLPSIRENEEYRVQALCSFLDKWEEAELAGIPLEQSGLKLNL